MRLFHCGSRALLALGLATVVALAMVLPVGASSHREAPLITEDPVADNTDVYAFVSPDKPDTVTLISNWIPFENPAGGPNFYNFGEDVLYTISIDNDGDAVSDVTYEWRFDTTTVDTNTFLYNTGPITVNGKGKDARYSSTFNVRQTYTLSVVKGGKRTTLGTGLPVPPNNVGQRSTNTKQRYQDLADAAIVDLPGGLRSFAGQRDEVFPVDLGSIFDLGGLRPFNEAHLVKLPKATGKNLTNGLNVHSVVLQVPTKALTAGKDPVIGVWSQTYRRKTRVFTGAAGVLSHSGPWVQVSRLGQPLVNEVVVPLKAKDVFNGMPPLQDAEVFPKLNAPPLSTKGPIPLVTDPILASLIPILYPGVKVPSPPRNDLVTIFLKGIPKVNQPAKLTRPSEMLRLNTSILPKQKDPNQQNRLGLLGGDNDGFPNGRRLNDDVVDIALRALAGATPLTKDFNKAPNNQLGDGVSGNDQRFLTSFPYIPHPFNGYDSIPASGKVN
ncbi:MAG: DUF4331 domain-containing protein [Egibacteraceae bacterium]